MSGDPCTRADLFRAYPALRAFSFQSSDDRPIYAPALMFGSGPCTSEQSHDSDLVPQPLSAGLVGTAETCTSCGTSLSGQRAADREAAEAPAASE